MEHSKNQKTNLNFLGEIPIIPEISKSGDQGNSLTSQKIISCIKMFFENYRS